MSNALPYLVKHRILKIRQLFIYKLAQVIFKYIKEHPSTFHATYFYVHLERIIEAKKFPTRQQVYEEGIPIFLI